MNRLYTCFSTLNKLRVLNIIRFKVVTISDLEKALGLNRQLIADILKEFMNAGLVDKQRERQKLVLYYCDVIDLPLWILEVLDPLMPEISPRAFIGHVFKIFGFDQECREQFWQDLDRYYELEKKGDLSTPLYFYPMDPSD